MFTDQLTRAIAAARTPQLDHLSAELWKAYAAGALSDDDAQAAAEAIRERKLVSTPKAPSPPKARRQRSPDRQASIARRRHLAASGPMPPALAARFTQAEMAAFRIIADEVRQHGVCALHIDAIAARAGTCRTVVKNALREARRLNLVTVQERRRRYLAASGPMPPALAARFTQAELAALRIVSDEVRHHGVCALHIDAIAAARRA
jgi:hypothetical protein